MISGEPTFSLSLFPSTKTRGRSLKKKRLRKKEESARGHKGARGEGQRERKKGPFNTRRPRIISFVSKHLFRAARVRRPGLHGYILTDARARIATSCGSFC